VIRKLLFGLLEEEEEIINVSLGENDMWPSENAKEEEVMFNLNLSLHKALWELLRICL